MTRIEPQSRRRYLVAYDIADGGRLRRVHKTVKEFGWSMKYAVFVSDLDRMELVPLKLRLSELIEHSADSVAIIDLGLPVERGRTCFDFLGAAPNLPTSGPIVI